MILTEQQLKQIIREEIQQMMLEEGWKDWARNAALAGLIASGVGAASPSYASDAPKAEPAISYSMPSDSGGQQCTADSCTIQFKSDALGDAFGDMSNDGFSAESKSVQKFRETYGKFADGLIKVLKQNEEALQIGDTTVKKVVGDSVKQQLKTGVSDSGALKILQQNLGK